MLRRMIIPALLCLAGLCAFGKSPAGIAFCDVDRLYDTLPALFYDDSDYTPEGRLKWNSARYERKVRQTAALIDSMGLDIVALWGVENEQVVRDIAQACRGDYAYIHRTLNSLDGMDFALLYYGDRLYPGRVETGRRFLRIEGEIDGEEVCLILCADPRMAEWVVRDVRAEAPGRKVLLMGRTAMAHPERLGLLDATARAALAGRGNRRSTRGSRWEMYHRILADTALRFGACDVYARRFLLDERLGTPVPTYSGRLYRGGLGRSLPVYIYIR